MNIKVSLETNEVSAAGIDQAAVIADIEAEIQKLATQLEVKLKRSEKPAPPGAQGEFELIEWILQLAQDPKMAVFYAKALIFAINQIVEAYHSKKKTDTSEDTPDSIKEKIDRSPVSINISGKTITLPAATIVIREFLKSIGDE